MTRARAPGKVVFSGAYAVLGGAPAIVLAVERDVVADTERPHEFLTDEVAAALEPNERAPWFDASALREDGRKLGLGSSAAILVASLFALEAAARPSADASEVDFYWTHHFTEFRRLRFGTTLGNGVEDDARVYVQFTSFFGSHAHGVNW